MIRCRHRFLIFAMLLSLLIALAACTKPSSSQPASRVDIRVAALRGPTGIGLVGLMSDQEAGRTRHNYSFELADAPNDIVAQLSSNQVDIAALPTNLAAVLYQRTQGKIRMLAVNTLGVLYILEKGNSIQSIADLSGLTIQATGQGAIPEYVLNELLANGGLSKPATVEYRSQHSELASLTAAGKADLVMLPEPFVTTVLSKNSDMRVALDLTEEWSKMMTATGRAGEMSMGCFVVSEAFAAEHPEALEDFLSEYQASVDFVNQNPVEAGEAVAHFSVMADAELAAKAIPNCYVVLIKGAAMQEMMEPFFTVLFQANPQSIGGKLPDPAFYWLG